VNVLLLSTYELGHQPIGLASPLGFLEAAGVAARGIDLAVEKLDDDAVRSAAFVGISVPMHTALRLGVEVATRVRSINPSCHICFYGLYAPLNRDYLLAHHGDSVIGGEYEAELVAAVHAVANAVRPTPRLTVLERLQFAPPSRRALLPLGKYARFLTGDDARLAGYVEASRGCLHLCRHCPIPAVYEGRFFVVPVATVVADVAAQVAAGAQHITIGDPDFFNGPNHAMAVARAIHAAHPRVTFDVTIKIEHILKHRHFFVELAALGCAFVVSAVESLSDRVLALLDKGHTRADIEAALDILAAAKIPLRPSLVSFTPWTTLDDYLDVLDWIDRRALYSQLEPVHLAIRLLIPPGSLLLALPELQPMLGALDEAKLTYRWTHPDPRMEMLAAAVHARVASAGDDEPPEQTIAAIRALAHSAAGRPIPTASPPTFARSPRLSEAWFCCAEPTDRQFADLKRPEAAASPRSADTHAPAAAPPPRSPA
jgi:radical SAM superfamily enzyme YgiQ (UPF0313 family)